MSLDVLARLGQIIPEPGCVYTAIEAILPSCRAPEDSVQRTRLSVNLALCEFEAAGIPYPPQCHQISELSSCTAALESKATWWTTFSNSYRHISAVCTEYRPEYVQRSEAERVVYVYRNASNLYAQSHELVERSLAELERKYVFLQTQFDALHMWEDVAANITTEMNIMSAVVVAISSSLHTLHAASAQNIAQAVAMQASADDARNTFTELRNGAMEIHHVHADMASMSHSMAEDMNYMHSEQSKALKELQLSINGSISMLQVESNKLKESLHGAVAIIRVLGVFVRFLKYTGTWISAILLLVTITTALFRFHFSDTVDLAFI